MSRKKGLIGMLLFLFILAAMLYALLPWALAQSARAQSEAAATDTAGCPRTTGPELALAHPHVPSPVPKPCGPG